MAPASTLLMQELFDSGDERFFAELAACADPRALKSLATRWTSTGTPFARTMLLRYADDGCDRVGHRPLVKALFKHAETQQDDEAMGHFMVAFDRLSRRKLRKRSRWDRSAGGIINTASLVPDGNAPAFDHEAELFNPEKPPKKAPLRSKSALTQFSRHTRMYLARRAFRYFRKIGKTDPDRYVRAMLATLPLYQDAHLATPAQLMDSWSLLHVLYWGSDVLSRQPLGVRVGPGRSLEQLKPAPIYPAVWKSKRDEMLDLIIKSRSRTVRTWAAAWVRQEYPASALRGVPLPLVRTLLASPDDEIQAFGAELLKGAPGLDALPLPDWFSLLSLKNPAVLPLVCELVAKHVAPNRLTLAQCVELGLSQLAPVGELGLDWARAKTVRAAVDLGEIVRFGAAPTAVVREKAAPWILGLLASSPFANEVHARELLDSPHADARAAVLPLLSGESKFKDSTVLWASLAESPYDDTRAFLVKHLEERQKSLVPEALTHLWATTLLSVHRGGRAKRASLAQVASRVARRPGDAESLLPLLAITLRSVRVPERRAALAAVVVAATRTPSLKEAIARKMPELVLLDGVPA